MNVARARIVCIGNPLARQDWVGPAVYRELRARALPDGVDLVDGGLQGLNLLRTLDDVGCVVFVDTLVEADAGEGAPVTGERAMPTVIETPFERVPGDGRGFDHSGGLAYLLRAARALGEPLPRAWVVGMPASAPTGKVREIAARCLELADGL